VTASDGTTNTLRKAGFIVVAARTCTVPDFAGVKVSNAQTRWSTAGFTTTVQTLPAPPKGASDYKINFQSLVGGTIDPQPSGCNSAITVGP
jgi:hypothetical protein